MPSNSWGPVLLRSQLAACVVVLLAVLVIRFPDWIDNLCVITVTSMVTVVALMPAVMWLALKAGAVDQPGGRRIHLVPTPRWGGIAVGLAVDLALVVNSAHYMPNIRALLVGANMMLLVGILDDVFPIRASIKLAVQLAACAVLIADGVVITFLPPTFWGTIGRWVVTIVWIIGITNAVNFLDGMDGLLAGLVMGCSLIFLVLSLLIAQPILAYCALAMFGAAFAFLGFNLKPARVFMGDGGSTFLGFFLAALSVVGEWARHDPLVSFCIPILVLSVPIYDMVFTTVARVGSGRVTSLRSWLEYTGKDHLHHRLEALGLTRGQVVIVICFLNMAVGMGAITLFEARTYGAWALLYQTLCVYIIIALLEVLGKKPSPPDA